MSIKQLLTKTILVAAALLAGQSAWAGVSTWTYSTTFANNTIGSAFSGSTNGIVSVQLGADDDGANWKILNTNSNNRGLAHNDNSVTLTENVPTAGTFVKVTAVQTCHFVLNFYRATTGYLRLIDAENASINILNERQGGSGGNKSASAKLTAGKTYYIYYNEDSSGGNFSITGFTASTYEDCTINYKYGETIIKSEVVNNYIGQTINATLTSMWDDGGTTKYYVADGATTSFTVADGTNTFDVSLRLAAIDAVATVNAIDAEGTVLKSFTATGIEGEIKDYIYYTRAVKHNGQYYAVAAANGNGRNYAKANIVYGGDPVTVTYTLDETITYYTEVEENLSKSRSAALSTEGAVPERASGGHWYRIYPNASVWTPALTSGVYKLEVSGRNEGKNNSTIGVLLRASDETTTEIGSLTWASANNSIQTLENILIPEGYSIQLDNSTEYNSGTAVDYIILRKVYDVTDAANIIGAVDYSTPAGAASSADYTIKQGDTKVFTFKNHGTTYGNNYRITVKEGATWKSNTRADFYDETGAYHLDFDLTDGTEDWNLMSTDGGSTKTGLNWDNFASDMANATVVATLVYGNDGKLTIDAISTGTTPGYKYYVHNEISGLSSDLTINLSVCQSWLEVLSVTTPITVASGKEYATFNSNYALDFSDITKISAYTASVAGSTVTLTKVAGAVPANTGLLIRNSDKDGETVYVPVVASADPVTNDFVAVTAESGVIITSGYVLATKDGVQGFYQANTSAGTHVAKGKAYLDSGAGARLAMNFDGEATGISAALNDKPEMINDKAFYNLQGQRVAQPRKGLYIVNGKKVIIK